MKICPALFSLLLIAALGCARPLPETELRRRLAGQSGERETFRSLSASYGLHISGRKPDGKSGRLTCSGRIVAARDQGLRMRGAKALGMARIFDFLMVGDRYRLSFIYGKKFFTGSVKKALARRKAGALVGEGRPNLAALLFPVPPGEDWGKREMVFGRREVAINWKRPDGSLARTLVVRASDARPLRTEIFAAEGKRAATIYYKKLLDLDGFHPVAGFKIRGTGRTRFRLDFSFSKMAINGRVKAAAFRLKAAPGFEVVDVDEREAGKQEPSESQ